MSAARCPNCGDAMRAQSMAGAHRPVEIDACYSCHAFWFDKLESPGLSQAAVLELFQRIHEHKDQPRRELGARLACPRCRAALAHTHDNNRGSKIEYDRCPDGCGRFTTFFQFLREKHFVRSVTPEEMTALRAQVRQVRCAGCGAIVSLEHSRCDHCGAPVSVVDADAARKALQPAAAAGAATLPTAASTSSSPAASTSQSSAGSVADAVPDVFVESVLEVLGWIVD